MTAGHYVCPLCGEQGRPDERRPAEIAGLEFRSVGCDADTIVHPFPVRWLESSVADRSELQLFEERFVYVRGPLPEGSAIDEAFGERDPIQAWIESEPLPDGLRVLIRL